MQARENQGMVPPGQGQAPQGSNGKENIKASGKPRWEMPRWANVTLTISSILLTLVSLFFGVRYLLNVRFLDSFNNGSYNASIPHTLTYLNFPDPYLPYHNFGCASFMLGNYDYAAGAFYEALQNDPPHDEPFPSRECQVRINLALSLTRPLDVNHWSSETERQMLIQTLTEARGYLTEDGCANPAKDVFDGHSEDAEQLKKDIDKALEKLQDPESQSDDSDDQDQQDQQDQQDDQQSNSGGQGGQQDEDRLKERLNDRKSDAAQNRAEEQQDWDDMRQMGGGDQTGSSGGGSGGGSEGGANADKRKTW